MKRVLVVLTGVMLASMLTAGGCVSKAELDKALALNKAAQTELEKTQAALRELRMRCQALEDDVAKYQAQLTAKDAQIANLEKANADLQRALEDLRSKMPKGPVVIEVDRPALPPELDAALRKFAEDNPDLVVYDPRLGMVKFKADLTFSPGSDIVTGAAAAAMEKFAQIMNSATGQRFNVYIAGHTDDMPISKQETRMRHPNNWYLSVHRSVAVEKVLDKAGLAEPRMGAMGFGEWHPIAPNAPGKKGNVINRRVEIWVVPPNRFLSSPVSSVAPEAPPATPATPGPGVGAAPELPPPPPLPPAPTTPAPKD